MNKAFVHCFAAAALLLPTPALAAATKYFSLGEGAAASEIPSSFGPFRAKSTAVGVYRAKLAVSAADAGQPLFIVIRTQADKSHRFGWLRAFVNNQLVATEQGMKENRIVEEVTKFIKPGETQISLMGAAYPDTGLDFYVVPKDMVLKVLQSQPLGSTLTIGGPYQAAGEKAEKFSDSFSLNQEEAAARTTFSIKTAHDKTHSWTWIRGYINGVPVVSEKDFSAGDATVDITGRTRVGENRIDVQGLGSPGTALGWYLMQLPTLAHARPAPVQQQAQQQAKTPVLNKLTPAQDVTAGASLVLAGENLSTVSKVYFDEKQATPKSLNATSISVDVPKDMVSGTCQVSVAAGGNRSNTMSINVTGLPLVRGTNPAECQPGRELEILGENFPERLGQLSVYLGSNSVKVLSTSKQSLLVWVPEVSVGTVLPVKVVIGQLKSNDDVQVKVTNIPSGQ